MHTLTEIQEKIHWNQVMIHGYDPICDAFSSWWLKLSTHMKNMQPIKLDHETPSLGMDIQKQLSCHHPVLPPNRTTIHFKNSL